MDLIDHVKRFLRKGHGSASVPANTDATLSLGSLAELSLDDKRRYIRALMPIAVTDNGVSEMALSRMYQLFAFAELSQRYRLEVLGEIFLRKTPLQEQGLTFEGLEIRMSLARDAIALDRATSSSLTEVAQKLLQRLNLTPGQIDFLRKWIDWENQIMDKIGRGDLQVRSEDLPTELLSRAAAVGVPLTALYFSGSVVGFSAAGITSGLASIGSATLLAGLGLNPMTAGIAALIVAGITIKKVLDAVLPNTREDKKKLEESLELMKTIRRRYSEYLYEDISGFAVGPWWEHLSGRATHRREAIRRLQQLAVGEKVPPHAAAQPLS